MQASLRYRCRAGMLWGTGMYSRDIDADTCERVLRCRAALAIRPRDYSLWNKLGATLANSSASHEAIAAYQKALDLKPNYMRAWTNMGIAQVIPSSAYCLSTDRLHIGL